jgi:hypothetical protein
VLGGTPTDFASEISNWVELTDKEYPKVNSLLAYQPIGSIANTGRWEQVEDLDFGYYYP